MSEQGATDTAQIWQHLAEEHKNYLIASVGWQNALSSVTDEDVDRVALVRYGLVHGGKTLAFHLAEYLSTTERMVLLYEWLLYASYTCAEMGNTRRMLKTLPTEWLLSNIEAAAEPLLTGGTSEDYDGLLDVYADVGAKEAFSRLVERASESFDPAIRQVGQSAVKDLTRFGAGS